MNAPPSPHAATDVSDWPEREGWRTERPCPCCPASATPTFRASAPCGRLILHAADPYETGTLLYSLSPAKGLGSWTLTMPGELAVSVLAAVRDALGPATAPPTGRPIPPLQGIDLLDHALSRIRQEVVTICLRIDDDIETREAVMCR
ncbi:hypothetical protein [Actinospica robiniae]|uniref:hypothetical protein n=1 Tax=Actinospica robiniae TaxID=304901 RepID=UPI0003F57EE5|nr:hypothetical protein [Actinospica robiniae]